MHEPLPFAFALGQQVRWVEPSDIPAYQARRERCWLVVEQEWRNHLDYGQSEWYLIRLAAPTGDWMVDRTIRVHRSALVAWETPAEEHHDG